MVAPRAGPPPVRAPEVPGDLRRILLRVPNWIGDVVLVAPTVEAIGRARPGAELVALAKPALAGLARLLPGVARVLPAGRDRGPGDLLATRRALRAEGFDAAVVFPRGAHAALGPWAAAVPVRVGLAGRGPLLTHPVGPWRAWRREHRSAFYGLLARPFGVEPAGPWRLEAPAEALERAARLLRGLGRRPQRPLVVLEAGAAYGPAKQWPAGRWGTLARGLLAGGIDVAVIGAPASLAGQARIEAVAGPGVLAAVGHTPDLLDLVGVLAHADLVVANDTGPMHVAAALGTPVLALFGATDPVVSGPVGPGPRRLLLEAPPCSPCFLRRCAVPGHPCMTALGPARVLDAARAMLAAGAGA